MSGLYDKQPWCRGVMIALLHKESTPTRRFVVTAVDIAIDKMMESVYLNPKKR